MLRLFICILLLPSSFFALNSYASSALDPTLKISNPVDPPFLEPENEFYLQSPPTLNFSSAVAETRWELVGLTSAVTFLGIKTWDWGSSSFKMNSEGWFGMNTGSGAADKLGHLYSSYLMSEWLTHQLNAKTHPAQNSAFYGALLSWSLMLYVELFDGVSEDHGFSNHDLLANTLGIGFSYVKNTHPWLDNSVDLRVEYVPSDGLEGIHMVTDYSGYRYLMAIKPAGFNALKNTCLKYFEFHLGYYTRGFREEDKEYFDEREATFYTAVGINLSELLFNKLPKAPYKISKNLDTFFHYYQLPKLYLDHAVNRRTAPLR